MSEFEKFVPESERKIEFSPELFKGVEKVEVPLPNSELKGIEIRLPEGNGLNASQIMEKLGFKNENGEDNLEAYENFKNSYAFLVVKNVRLENEKVSRVYVDNKIYTDTQEINSKNSGWEQGLHRDGVVHASNVFSLYHPVGPYEGRTETRPTKTNVMDAKLYFSEVRKFFLDYSEKVKGGKAEWPEFGVKMDIEDFVKAIKNPKESRFYERALEEGSKYYSSENLTEKEKLELDEVMITDYLLNKDNEFHSEKFLVEDYYFKGHTLKVNEVLDKDIKQISWEQGDLVFINNDKIVHGMGEPVRSRESDFVKKHEIPVVRLSVEALEKL